MTARTERTREGVRCKARQFARDVAREIIEDPATRQLIREMVLRILVEQEVQKQQGLIRSFLLSCDQLGIKLRLAPDGKLKATNVSVSPPNCAGC
jgi:hypothetical protein